MSGRPINGSRMLLAEAAFVSAENKFLARYALPGAEIHTVHDEDGRDIYFDTLETAEAAAHIAAVETFNAIPPKSGKPDRYQKISGQVLAQKITESGITATFLAFLLGTAQERVIMWMRGEDGAPHPAYVLLEIFRDREIGTRAIDIAERATNSVTEARTKRDSINTPLTADSE